MAHRQAIKAFKDRFGRSPDCVLRAPGRVNLIGEHTDYSDGLVLPMAIDRGLLAAAACHDQPTLEVYSAYFGQTVRVHLRNLRGCVRRRSDDPSRDREGAVFRQIGPLPDGRGSEELLHTHPLSTEAPLQWCRYVIGVTALLQRQGILLRGVQLWIGGDLPPGAGLASSAALEVGVALALLHGAGSTLSPLALATLCQQAEQEFAASPCGIMDQLCCTSARAGHALLIDCRSLETQHIPLNLGDAAIVVIDSGVRHSIAGAEYAKRRRECAAALDAIRQLDASIESLRDVTAEHALFPSRDCDTSRERERADEGRQRGNKATRNEGEGRDPLCPCHEQSRDREGAVFEPYRLAALDPTLLRRVRHIVTENARVVRAAKALQDADMPTLGSLMNESHASLRDDFAVSCAELDAIVEIALGVNGVYGARLTGGGFGGCVIALATRDAIPQLASALRDSYDIRFAHRASVFTVAAAESASLIDAVGR